MSSFNPSIFCLLRLFSTHERGLSRDEVYRQVTPQGDRALQWLLEVGVVEERGELLIPQPSLQPLAQKMERLAALVNHQAQAREHVMELVRVILRGV